MSTLRRSKNYGMKVPAVLALSALALLLGLSARAEDLTGRIGLGGSVGAAVPIGSNWVTDRSKTGLGAGGWVSYGFSENWGVRASYDQLNFRRGEMRMRPLNLAAAYALAPQSAWNPSVRAGMGVDFITHDGLAEHRTLFGYTAGLAVDRFLTKWLSLGAAIDYFGAAKDGPASEDAHGLRAGLTAGLWFGGAAPQPVAQAPAPAPVSIALSPASASLLPGGTQAFAATVSGTENMGVTWSLSPALGSISEAGAYTAPAAIASSAAVTVTAASQADPSKTAAAQVLLNPASPVAITLSPASSALGPGGSQAFAAAVSGTPNTGVTWKLEPPVGSITPEGVYTAPVLITSPQAVTVTAASVADPSRTTSAQLQLAPAENAEVRLSIEFDKDSDALKPEYDIELKKAAEFFKAYPSATAVIEGHTDNAGDAAYNRALSERRANAVRQALIDRFGVDGAKLTAKGYGEEKPLADNSTAEGRARNRCVLASFSALKVQP